MYKNECECNVTFDTDALHGYQDKTETVANRSGREGVKEESERTKTRTNK